MSQLFTPVRIGRVTATNRLVMAPMAQPGWRQFPPTRSEDATIPVMAVELNQIFRRALKLDPVDRLLTLQGFEER